jgi:hypothetical protein
VKRPGSGDFLGMENKEEEHMRTVPTFVVCLSWEEGDDLSNWKCL